MTYHIKTEKSFLKEYDFDNSDHLIEKCIEEVNPKLIVKPQIIVYGKPAVQHRNVSFFSDESIGYYYSGKLAKSIQLTPNLKILLDIINNLFNSTFNGILVNKYCDGNDSIGAHSDDETNLDDIGVVGLSYGAERKFRIRDKKTRKIIKDIPTISGKILHMGGMFQKDFLHEIPQQKKIKSERFSFTFRKHNK